MAAAEFRSDEKGKTPLLEWVAAGIGLLLTLSLLGVVGRNALNGETEQLPVITVVATAISPAAPGYVVGFDATNRTGGTAAAVEIEATLKDGETVIETGKAVLDYIPGHGMTKGGVYFIQDPRQHKLQIRALGFQTP